MPLDLLTLPASEAERIAYSEGFTMAAELFARIAELEAEGDETDTTDSCWGFETFNDYHETVGREMAIVLAESAAKESEAAIYWASRDVQTVNRRGV